MIFGEFQQVPIPADDYVSASLCRTFKHTVIIWVFVDDSQDVSRFHNLGNSFQPCAQERRVLRRHSEFIPELIVEFFKRERRDDKCEGSQKGQVQKLTR